MFDIKIITSKTFLEKNPGVQTATICKSVQVKVSCGRV